MGSKGGPLSSHYHSLRDCVEDLRGSGQLLTVETEVSPHLELAEIQRRTYRAGGPAVLFTKVRGTKFPCLSNLYGSDKRLEYIFRSTIPAVEKAIRLRTSPPEFLKSMARDFWRTPFEYMKLPFTGLTSLPRRVRRAPVLHSQTNLSALPQIVCWPMDGGPFVTLPQVFSKEPGARSVMKSNLGMYRVQLAGNRYKADKEVGLHYQIHRGIGVHHQQALCEGQDLPVSIFVGGPPAHAFAAVMPLPENLSELIFAGMLAGRRFHYLTIGEHVISADADFCITGWIRGRKTKREGPFGDHLGYYSLTHEFPFLEVERVYHRRDAIWPFTVVGRPPQEDTHFGRFIHRITGDIVTHEIPGVKALHAVDASGVHPLLFAIGSERYTPYRDEPPKELLTQANAILGFNQCSLAKYLFICDQPAHEKLDIHNERLFIRSLLERVDFSRDLHFYTKTTIDTLDYSSEELNYGSKLAIVVNGEAKRKLSDNIPKIIASDPQILDAQLVDPGILAITIDPFTDYDREPEKIEAWLKKYVAGDFPGIALIVLADDSRWMARDYINFIWATFTRSNPSHDLYGVEEQIKFKHWQCAGPLIIDARKKPHHAPELIEDEKVTTAVDKIIMQEPQLKKMLASS